MRGSFEFRAADPRHARLHYLVVYPPLTRMVCPVIHQPSVTRKRIHGTMSAMSGRPTAATASGNKRSIAAADVRSPCRATALLPAACTAATVASASAWVAALL